MQWKDKFAKETLKQSEEYVGCIEDIYIMDNHVNANLKKSSHFHVGISLTDDDEIGSMFCTCRKNEYCKHEAAVLTYIEENDFIQKEKDFLKLVETADESNLRQYFRDVLNDNPEIKRDFIEKFKKEKRIDASKYFSKLEAIIESSESYDNFARYDIDLLAGGIYDFILDDLYDLMRIRQYEVICDLLERIAEVLNDEMYVNEDSWYDACEEYLQLAYKLEDTYVLSDEQLDTLEKNTSFMQGHM